MPKFYGQNKKRIDPRYFLEETTNRDEEEPPFEGGVPSSGGDPQAIASGLANQGMVDQLAKEFADHPNNKLAWSDEEPLPGRQRKMGLAEPGHYHDPAAVEEWLEAFHPQHAGDESMVSAIVQSLKGSPSQQEIPDEVEDKIRDILDSDSDSDPKQPSSTSRMSDEEWMRDRDWPPGYEIHKFRK